MIFSSWCKAASSTDKFTPNYVLNSKPRCWCLLLKLSRNYPRFIWSQIPMDSKQLMHHYSEWPPMDQKWRPQNLCQLAFPHLMREPNYYDNVPFLIVSVNVCYEQSASNALGNDPILTGQHHPKQRQKCQH